MPVSLEASYASCIRVSLEARNILTTTPTVVYMPVSLEARDLSKKKMARNIETYGVAGLCISAGDKAGVIFGFSLKTRPDADQESLPRLLRSCWVVDRLQSCTP